MIGKQLGHYRIIELLGKGGMGEVYLAEDMKLDRKAALKILPPELAGEEERRLRFQREAKAIATLSHPNIVTRRWEIPPKRPDGTSEWWTARWSGSSHR